MYQARLIDYLRKIAQVAILLLLFSSQLIVMVPTVSCGDVVEVSANDIKQKLNKYCLRRLNFKTIAQFNDFVEIFREFDEITPVPDKLLEEDDKLGHLVQCLYEKESIYALQQLVNNYDRERPCKYTEVTKLEEYAKEHFISNPTAKTMKFFTLFGVTIGINCQINLMAHLKQADAEVEQMDFIYSTAAPTGWNVLIDEYTKKSMKYGTSTNQDSHVINKIARLVPGLSSIDQVDYLNFHHVMNDVEISQHATKESGYHELKNLQLKPKVVASLYKVINSCKNLDKFYVNLVLSMAKLNGLNLLANVLHGLHDHNALLHKWLVATSFCQLMSRVEMITPDPLKKNEKKKKKQFLEQISIPDENSPYIKFDLVHYDLFLEDRRVLYSYAAPFEEIHERAGEFAWQAMVNEGSWRQKREAIWLPGERPAISRAMRSLVQYVKGVEHDFQYELDHQNTQQEKNLDAE